MVLCDNFSVIFHEFCVIFFHENIDAIGGEYVGNGRGEREEGKG